MPGPKKIFFSYSKTDKDLELYSRMNKFFTADPKVNFLAAGQ